MLSNHRLRYHYSRFNKLYFGNNLPPANIFFEHGDWKMGAAADALIDPPEQPRIRINPLYAHDWNVMKVAILHEMAHISIYPRGTKHTKAFYDEIDRLYSEGAYKGLL